MSLMKRWLEEISEEMGLEGEINDAVMAEGQKRLNAKKTPMTQEQAKAIIDAFGPCTTLYECTTPEELIKEYQEDDTSSIADFVQTLYDVEDVHNDRAADAAYEREAGDGPKGHHQKVVSELGQSQKSIKGRLAALGYEVK